MKDTAEILAEALKVLKEGGVILYPTDTVWGLGCDATNAAAVERIFEIKHRPANKSLVLLASDLDMVARFVRQIPSIAIDLVEVNDSPMTIIYPEGQGLAPNVLAEDSSVGIRIPMNEFCRSLAFKLRRPLVSTSANISGEPTPALFREISPEIKNAVDYCVPAFLEKEATGKASQIIKLGLDGEVEIIRR
ncbi:MAG: threonylcarbamoyl-AMP synthase [Bacteroidales bacterium]|nr:threonylcarbamoyl-AMP synthase [Bacteroidales bacterium]